MSFVARSLLVTCFLAAVVAARTQPVRWTFREVTTIGFADSGPASFDFIVSVVADAKRNVYVADRDAHQVRAFEESGRPLWTVGRRGPGPAEFGQLSMLAWRADTLLASDAAPDRISLISTDGKWVGHVHAGVRASNLLRAGTDVYAMYAAGGRGNPAGYRYLWLRGQRIDTIGVVAREERVRVRCTSEGAGLSYTLPYPPDRVTVVAPGGLLASALTSRYRIMLVNRAGDTVQTIEKPHRPIAISDARWNEATASLRAAVARGVSCNPSRFDRPAQLPAIQDMFYDADGRLWVETWTATARSFDIFDQSGRQIATADVPRQLLRMVYVRGDRLYTIVSDSVGLNAVKVFAIDR